MFQSIKYTLLYLVATSGLASFFISGTLYLEKPDGDKKEIMLEIVRDR